MKEIRSSRSIVFIGMLGALSAVLMLISVPLPFAPGFLKFDIAELPALFAGFFLGPVGGCAVIIVKILLKLVTQGTDTAFVGDPMSKSYPSIQEELIALSEQKYQEALNKPGIKQNELHLAELLVQLFKDEDKIRQVPMTVITGGLVFYGIRYRKSCEIYEKLMEEVNRKYVLIHPDSIE